MPKLIDTPAVIEAAGNKPKRIEEYIGNVNTKTSDISVAKMTSPGGWVEPGQTPEFKEITYVISGELHVEHKEGTLKVKSGQSVENKKEVGSDWKKSDSGLEKES